MYNNFLVYDNFYNNVDEVRSHALSLEYNIVGNYPGTRTTAEDSDQLYYLKVFFEKLLCKTITYFPSDYNTAYQLTLEDDESWVHYDNNEWAGILYLTPDAPLKSGTSIYRHRETLAQSYEGHGIDHSNDGQDLDKWEETMSTSNIYNRLVLYRGNMYHRSSIPGFGKTKETGRLFQTFFFDTGE